MPDDPKKPEDLKRPSPQENGLIKLHNRAARLARLVTLDAPGVFIAYELLMVMDAMWLAYPEDMGTAMAERQHERVKHLAGFCTSKDCPNAVVQGELLCPKCDHELETEDKH